MALGEYESVTREALEMLSSGPWRATDLSRIQEVINEDFCAQYGPECRSTEVVDWLNSLGPEEQDELLSRFNSELND